jgi:hypothetical protein
LKFRQKLFLPCPTLPSFHLFLYYYYYYYFFFFFLPSFLPSFFVVRLSFFNPNPDPVCIQTRVPVLKVYINVNTYGDIRLVPKGQKKEKVYMLNEIFRMKILIYLKIVMF